jgi:hypothetical protein
MVGDRKKVVPSLTIPIGDHLWKIIAIAPQRVGVQVSLPPLQRTIRLGDAIGVGTLKKRRDFRPRSENGKGETQGAD